MVAVITLNHPPVNSLSCDVRAAVVTNLDRAQEDSLVRAIVLIGAGKDFSGGADIREFNTPRALAEPTLRTTIRRVEASAKPAIAAIGGTCMGGGLELALGCHFRVASRTAQIALPEVKLGLLPGAGGTQRLPRAIGVEAALDMIVSGAAAPAERFKGTALFDEIVEGDLLAAALAFARRLIDEKRPVKRVRDLEIDFPDAEAFFRQARNKIGAASRNFPAPLKCVEAVATAVATPFEEGLAIEREFFLQLIQSPESRAQRHAFFSERAAGKIPDVPADTLIRKIERVGVIGAGTMGGGIAMNFLSAGIPVTILELKREILDKGVATIRGNYENSLRKGKLTQEKLDQCMGLLTPTLSYDDLEGADLVIEAVFEEMGVKKQVFQMLDERLPHGAILATNTSTLDINKIAAFTRRPQDVVGLHFFSPAHVMKLLEVVRGNHTASDVLAAVMQLAKKIRKTAVVSRVCDGFIGNRMLRHYARQAQYLLEEGASPQQVDQALEAWGMAMGPFRMGDLAGNDIGWAIRKRLHIEQPELKFSGLADRLCEMGRYGQKVGAGWYRYEPGRRDPIPDPAVDRMIADYRAEIGLTPRRICEEEIVQRCILALVNEGARILEEGIAARASDIDVVYLAGYGFPLYRGGPMFYADTAGLLHIVRAMEQFASAPDGDAKFWKPAALLARLAEENKTFN
jgi:3-hydroxyacyl-CoA dehydrogenase